MRLSWFFFAILLSFSGTIVADDPESPPPLPIGNFSVPLITQISPLIAFGQLNIGKGALLSQFSGSYTQGHDNDANVINPNIIYGIRDDLSLLISLPYNIDSKINGSRSSGIEDMYLQLEYGYFAKSDLDYSIQATVVGNVQFPTGSSSKNPPTGAGSFSYFLGATFSYTSSYWYAFASSGANLATSHHGKKSGNSYLYQCGFARYIEFLSPRGWIFDLMFELDGTYTEKNKIHGGKDPNTGGNLLLATPSLWLSSSRWILQGGVAFPLLQEWNGQQDKIDYTIAYNLAIAIQF